MLPNNVLASWNTCYVATHVCLWGFISHPVGREATTRLLIIIKGNVARLLSILVLKTEQAQSMNTRFWTTKNSKALASNIKAPLKRRLTHLHPPWAPHPGRYLRSVSRTSHRWRPRGSNPRYQVDCSCKRDTCQFWLLHELAFRIPSLPNLSTKPPMNATQIDTTVSANCYALCL